MKRLFSCIFALSTLMATSIPASAIDMTQAENRMILTEDEEAGALGGWSEETGYFQNVNSYNKAAAEILKSSSTPRHTGKRERVDIDGNTHYRAHGWTTWVGVHHYTRARLEVDGEVLIYYGEPMDSGRQWGMDGTEAASPWWPWSPDYVNEKARTYYGT